MEFVPDPAPHRYHHGDLANALIGEAVELARHGGPEAVVLREVARRAGVSATAAYRHFDSHEALLDAVAGRAFAELAQAMLAEMAALPRHRVPALAALERWRASGRGYVRFAVTQPGLFRTVFMRAKTAPPPPEDGTTPSGLLSAALDECVRTGALPAHRRPGAEELSWIGVHGLSVLAIDGILPASGPAFEQLLERTLDLVGEGLGAAPYPGRRPRVRRQSPAGRPPAS